MKDLHRVSKIDRFEQFLTHNPEKKLCFVCSPYFLCCYLLSSLCIVLATIRDEIKIVIQTNYYGLHLIVKLELKSTFTINDFSN